MKKVAVFIADGFEEIEALTVVDVMRRAGLTCDMVSISDSLKVRGAHNIYAECNKCFDDELKEYDLIVFPGGMPGATNLQKDKNVLELVKYFDENEKFIGAICAAPIVLSAAGVIKDRNITSYPGFEEQLQGCNYKKENVVVDKNIITSRGPATAMEFSYKLLEILGEESYKEIRSGMLFK